MLFKSKRISDITPSTIGATLHAQNTLFRNQTSVAFNTELNQIFNDLNADRQGIQMKVDEMLSAGDGDLGRYRSSGVGLAWEYETADVKMGGRGSTDWNSDQLNEILESGRVRGAEGHHINNVADHLDLQGNPDNIRFAKSRAEHLGFHDGDFKNTTKGKFIDKNIMLEETNRERLFANELTGIGTAIAIGLGVGFTITLITELAQKGVSIESLKSAALKGAGKAFEMGMLGAVTYGVTRTIGASIVNGVQGLLTNAGYVVTNQLFSAIGYGVFGTLGILTFSVYHFIKLKQNGFSTDDALRRVGMSAAVSLGILGASVLATYFYGGVAGLLVSMALSALIFSFKLAQSTDSDSIQIYTIERLEPVY